MSHAFNLKSWAEASSSRRSLIHLLQSRPSAVIPPPSLAERHCPLSRRWRKCERRLHSIFEISHRIRAARSKHGRHPLSRSAKQAEFCRRTDLARPPLSPQPHAALRGRSGRAKEPEPSKSSLQVQDRSTRGQGPPPPRRPARLFPATSALPLITSTSRAPTPRPSLSQSPARFR